MNTVLTKFYDAPPISHRDILRYAGAGDSDIGELLNDCIAEAQGALEYKVCYMELPVKICGELCQIGELSFLSCDLAKNLSGCIRAVIFAATVGTGIDRLIMKYGRISPSRALIFQAIGAERIEALCDRFCLDVAEGRATKPRFSPGYGDLSIEHQRDIFALLDCPRKIGLSLVDSKLMTPTKSVTAIMGIK